MNLINSSLSKETMLRCKEIANMKEFDINALKNMKPILHWGDKVAKVNITTERSQKLKVKQNQISKIIKKALEIIANKGSSYTNIIY
ncbi:unnamed protein product [Gordionus sp. m RMFG-2023]